MSWTKDIFIKYLDIKIEINKNRVLKLNNERVYPPFILPDGTRIEKSGNYISVSTFFGIQIFYDGDGNAEIKVRNKKFYFLRDFHLHRLDRPFNILAFKLI